MIAGDQITEYLSQRLSEHQEGKSVFWQDMLADFSYSADRGSQKFKGFGVLEPDTLSRRVFHRLMQIPYRKMGRDLPNFDRLVAIASGLARGQKRSMNMDLLRQALTIALCDSQIPDFRQRRCQVVIGDGLGGLGGLLALFTDAQVFSVNLNEVLLIDYGYMAEAVGAEKIVLVQTAEDVRRAAGDPDIKVAYIQADHGDLIEALSIDVAYNINSMQEMVPDVIAGYFRSLRACDGDGPYFYCCNREMNRLADGNVLEIQKYPWRATDQLLVDEPCPWNQTFYASRPPFIRPYDGATRHRLAKFTNAPEDRGA